MGENGSLLKDMASVGLEPKPGAEDEPEDVRDAEAERIEEKQGTVREILLARSSRVGRAVENLSKVYGKHVHIIGIACTLIQLDVSCGDAFAASAACLLQMEGADALTSLFREQGTVQSLRHSMSSLPLPYLRFHSSTLTGLRCVLFETC